MTGRQSILLVDDYSPNLISLEAVLESPFWHLLKAHSGEEALKVLAEQEVSMVLLDVQMPGMDGFAVLNAIRQDKRFEYLPVILLSAVHRDDQSILKGYELGAVDYLCKPLNPYVLRAKVDYFMKVDQRRRQLEDRT